MLLFLFLIFDPSRPLTPPEDVLASPVAIRSLLFDLDTAESGLGVLLAASAVVEYDLEWP